MSHPHVVCGPVGPTDCAKARDLASLVCELSSALADAEAHLEPTLDALSPAEPKKCGPADPCGSPNVFDGLVGAVVLANRVRKLARLVAERVGHGPMPPDDDCRGDAPAPKRCR